MKKTKQKTKRKHKSNYILVYIMIGLMTAVVLVVLSLTVFFPIQTVEVEGSSIYSKQQIEKIADVAIGKNLFTADMSAVENNVVTSLPYIERVQIKRCFPSTIKLIVLNAESYLQLKNGDKYAKLSQSGKCLEITDKLQKGTPLLLGAQAKSLNVGYEVEYNKETTAELINTLMGELEKNELTDITVVNVGDEQDLSATYNNKIALLFGSSANIDIKAQHAKTIIKLRENNNETGTLNLSRLPNEKDQTSFIPCELNALQRADY